MSINKAAVPGSGQMLQKTMGRIKFVTQGMNATAHPQGAAVGQESCASEPVEGGNARKNPYGLNQEWL